MIFQAVICSFKKTSADVRIFGSRHLQCNLNKNLKALEYVFIYLSLSRLSSDSYIITGDTYGLLFQIFGRSFKTQASNTHWPFMKRPQTSPNNALQNWNNLTKNLLLMSFFAVSAFSTLDNDFNKLLTMLTTSASNQTHHTRPITLPRSKSD